MINAVVLKCVLQYSYKIISLPAWFLLVLKAIMPYTAEQDLFTFGIILLFC